MKDIHIIPLNDTQEHNLSDYCPCEPKHDKQESNVIIHNAFDGREAVEWAQDELNLCQRFNAVLSEPSEEK